MSEQLDLFPDSGTAALRRPEDEEPTPADAGALDELFRLDPRWRSSIRVLALFEFISRFPGYSPYNGFLLFLQDPEAALIATARTWLRKFNRRIKAGARPLLILAPMSPVLFLFDLRDTEGLPLSPGALRPGPGRERPPARLFEALVRSCGGRRIAVREESASEGTAEEAGAVRLTPALRKKHQNRDIESGARYLIRLEAAHDIETRCAALVLELAHLFCGHLGADAGDWWSDRRDVSLERMDIEAESAAFLFCRRQGLHRPAERFLAACRNTERELPAFSLAAVLQATAHIESMAKR